MKTYNNPTTNVVELDLLQSVMGSAVMSLNGESLGGGGSQSTPGDY